MPDPGEIRQRPDRPLTSHGPVEYHPQTQSLRAAVGFQVPSGQRRRGSGRRPPAETALPGLSVALPASAKSIATRELHVSLTLCRWKPVGSDLSYLPRLGPFPSCHRSSHVGRSCYAEGAMALLRRSVLAVLF